MHGSRDAAQIWANEYAEMLVSVGFRQGNASPCVFHYRERGVRTFVHGGDFVSTATHNQLTWLKEQFEIKCKIKQKWLDPGKGHQQELETLNRIVGWDQTRGVVYEVDPRHTEIIIEQFKFTDAKTVATFCTKEEGTTTTDCAQELDEQHASQYRATTARCNYISPDRPDISYIVKGLARRMSKPIRGDCHRPKRLGRYLLG